MGSIYSSDYEPGYAQHVCDVDHSGGNGLPDPDTSDHGGSGTDSTDNHTRTDSTDTCWYCHLSDAVYIDWGSILRSDVFGAIAGAVLGEGIGALPGAALGSSFEYVYQVLF